MLLEEVASTDTLLGPEEGTGVGDESWGQWPDPAGMGAQRCGVGSGT